MVMKQLYSGIDTRLVTENVYWSYRSSHADSCLIDKIPDERDKDNLSKAIKDFRKLVYQKRRGYSRLAQANDQDTDDRNFIRARLEVQKDDPVCIHTIKKILQRYGIAETLFMGDWLVTRDGKAQAEACGTRRFAEIETFMTQWYYKHWLIEDKKIEYSPNISGGKLVHLSLWCGSGDIMLENQSNTDKPLGEWKWNTTDYWTEVWMCDRIYYSLTALFRGCLKPGHTQAHILEFCDFLTTCVNQDIQKQKIEDPNNPHDLQIDINLLPWYILEHASRFGNKLKERRYASDGEFPDGKNITEVSSQAQSLIDSFALNPQETLKKYFLPVFLNGNIAWAAPFLFHNVFVDDFKNFDKVFHGDDPRFHMITSVRWSSHINNIPYKNLIRSSCKKLKPGGIIIDDWIRRSYSRECRWKEMHELSLELWDNYKFHFNKSSTWEILSVFIQRVAVTPKWDKVFLTLNEIREGVTGKEGGIAIPLNNYGKGDESEKIYLVKAEVRNAIMVSLLWWSDREMIDWDKLLKLWPLQDTLDRAESMISDKIRQVRIWQWDTRKAVKDYIKSISDQVLHALWTNIIKPNSNADAIFALQKLTDSHRKSVWIKKQEFAFISD